MNQQETFGTVTINFTSPDENIEDLLNLTANLGFIAGFSAEELVMNARTIIEEQYTQAILNAPQHEETE